jgi:hypothetical protein
MNLYLYHATGASLAVAGESVGGFVVPKGSLVQFS